ncbi:MAG: hydrogenase maturation nickel metallochaperone HypA [Halorientalis sp.]
MHELTVARRLVDRAVATARDHDADRIDALTVRIGAATHVVPDQIAFCIETIAEGTPAEDATIRFERVPARGECACGWEGELDTLADTVAGAPDRRCPECGGGVTLTAGTECGLTRIETPDPRDTHP